MSNILIEANNIARVYDPDIFLKRGKNFYALDNVNFVLEQGDFTCIMGPSGSGKSTLLNCLSTLDRVTSGHVLLEGIDMTTLNKDQLCEFRYKTLGFIFQDHNLIPYLTIFDNIATPALLGKQNSKVLHQKIINLAKDLEIYDLLDKYPHECSGGECQRVAIARALINEPKVIFCDEPTGNLDSKNSHKVLSILSHLNKQGTSIILVTHDPMIASYSKKMMYLYDGGIKTVIYKHDASQMDFFRKISEITMQDSLLYEFKNSQSIQDEKVEITTENNYLKTNKDNLTEKDIEVFKVENIEKEFVSRQSVYMIIKDKPIDEVIAKHNTPFTIDGTTIYYCNKHNDNITFDLSIVKEIHLDLKSRFVNFGLFSQFTFYTLVDFITDKGTYTFAAHNQDDFIHIINYFHSLSIPIDDPREIEAAYKKYPRELERCKFFQRTHKDLTKYGSYNQESGFDRFKANAMNKKR